jgi:hypothetical protein
MKMIQLKFQNQQARRMALVSGYGILFMALLAGFSYGYVPSQWRVEGDPLLSLQQIQASIGLFRLSVAGWVGILLLDLLVSWSLYRFFRGVDLTKAILMGSLRIAYSLFLASAILNFADILSLLQSFNGSATLEGAERVEVFMQSFEAQWNLGLIVFGLHLLVLGNLVYQSHVPHMWAYLLWMGGAGYVLLHTAKALGLASEGGWILAENIFILPMTLSELGLAFWLILKGGKQKDISALSKK